MAETEKPRGGRPYREMTGTQKVVWILKVAVCVLSFGIIFPGVMDD